MSSVILRSPLASIGLRPTPHASNIDFQHQGETYDEEDSSDDDQAVFLGLHQPHELRLLSKLSSTSSSPSPAVKRVKKRDSRDFLRRQTLVPVIDKKSTSSRSPGNDSDVSFCPSPLKTPVHSSSPNRMQEESDLTLDFAAFHLSTPRSASPDSSEAGSDKENVPMPKEDVSAGILGDMLNVPVIVIGQGHAGSDTEEEDLDMGGLRLSDFADPETGLEGDIVSPEVDSGDENNFSVSESSMDSPLPIERAGPVVIPSIPHHFASIRAESGSPCRALPQPVQLSLDPTEEIVSGIASPSPISPTRKEDDAPTPLVSTPSRVQASAPPELVQRGTKLLKSSTTKKPDPNPFKPAHRAVIKGQLTSALLNRVSVMGPPQRSVSSTSSASSSSSSSKYPAAKSSSITSKKHLPKPTATVPTRPASNLPATAGSRASSARPSAAVSRKAPAPLASSTTQNLPRPALAAKTMLPARSKPSTISKPSIPSSIPLKRPAPPVPAPTSRPLQPVARMPTAVPTKLGLGQPSRMFHPAPTAQMAPVFSVGVAGDAVSHRVGFRSPGKQGMMKRGLMEQGTPRKLGTPLRFGTPRQASVSIPIMCSASAASPAPVFDVSAVPAPFTSGSPATATRQSTESIAVSPNPARGSSEDHEEISMQLAKPPSPSPSPKKSASPKRTASRPKRTVKPPQPLITTIATASSVPTVSEKELKIATQRNTMHNQVYHCAIERQIIREPGPRPPSPTSKIRTTADRKEEEKKQAREDRAKRRKGVEEEDRPVIERMTRLRGPGEEEDFVTPARPTKRAKTDDKYVKWDKGLTVIRDDGSTRPSSREGSERPAKSCLRSQISLDQHGNVHDSHRPVDDLKRTRIVVTAVFYEGEEPVPAPAPAPAPATTTKTTSATKAKKK